MHKINTKNKSQVRSPCTIPSLEMNRAYYYSPVMAWASVDCFLQTKSNGINRQSTENHLLRAISAALVVLEHASAVVVLSYDADRSVLLMSTSCSRGRVRETAVAQGPRVPRRRRSLFQDHRPAGIPPVPASQFQLTSSRHGTHETTISHIRDVIVITIDTVSVSIISRTASFRHFIYKQVIMSVNK